MSTDNIDDAKREFISVADRISALQKVHSRSPTPTGQSPTKSKKSLGLADRIAAFQPVVVTNHQVQESASGVQSAEDSTTDVLGTVGSDNDQADVASSVGGEDTNQDDVAHSDTITQDVEGGSAAPDQDTFNFFADSDHDDDGDGDEMTGEKYKSCESDDMVDTVDRGDDNIESVVTGTETADDIVLPDAAVDENEVDVDAFATSENKPLVMDVNTEITARDDNAYENHDDTIVDEEPSTADGGNVDRAEDAGAAPADMFDNIEQSPAEEHGEKAVVSDESNSIDDELNVKETETIPDEAVSEVDHSYDFSPILVEEQVEAGKEEVSAHEDTTAGLNDVEDHPTKEDIPPVDIIDEEMAVDRAAVDDKVDPGHESPSRYFKKSYLLVAFIALLAMIAAVVVTSVGRKRNNRAEEGSLSSLSSLTSIPEGREGNDATGSSPAQPSETLQPSSSKQPSFAPSGSPSSQFQWIQTAIDNYNALRALPTSHPSISPSAARGPTSTSQPTSQPPTPQPTPLSSIATPASATPQPTPLPSNANATPLPTWPEPLLSTATPSVLPKSFHSPTSYLLACGGSSSPFCSGQTAVADQAEDHGARCCRDSAASGWVQPSSRDDICADVWGRSTDINGKCQFALNHEEASAMCAQMEGRLCTSEEILGDCTRDTGCGHNHVLIWSSTEATDKGSMPPPTTATPTGQPTQFPSTRSPTSPPTTPPSTTTITNFPTAPLNSAEALFNNPTQQPSPRPRQRKGCITNSMYDEIDSDIEKLANAIPDDETRAHFMGGIVRLTAHDFMDFDRNNSTHRMGPDGCFDPFHPANAGLPDDIWCQGCLLTNLYTEKYSSLSRADFWIASANAVIRQTSVDNALDLRDTFEWGRIDTESCIGSAVRLPSPQGCSQTEDVFITRMGLSWRDATALMGAHTLGRGDQGFSGHEGTWVESNREAQVFDKAYYEEVFLNSWRPRNIGLSNEDWTTGDGIDRVMLNTDLCLVMVLEGNMPCCSGNRCTGDGARLSRCPRIPQNHPRTEAFLAFEENLGGGYPNNNNDPFYSSFREAWRKAINVGQQNLSPLADSCDVESI